MQDFSDSLRTRYALKRHDLLVGVRFKVVATTVVVECNHACHKSRQKLHHKPEFDLPCVLPLQTHLGNKVKCKINVPVENFRNVPPTPAPARL